MAGNFHRFRGRPTKRQAVITSNAAFNFYGMAGHIQPVPEERAKRKPSGLPLERDILADILSALRRDPRIWIVERTQSGLFQDGDRMIRVGTKGKLDITGMLRGGKYYEIEVKRPGNKPDGYQSARIDNINRGGGAATWASSVATVMQWLDDAAGKLGR